MSNVRTGGLYRCCTTYASGIEGTEGQVIACTGCNSAIQFRNGAWEWAR